MRPTFHLPHRRTAELPPMERLLRDPVRSVPRERVRAASVLIARHVVEARGQASLQVDLHPGDLPYLDGLGLQRDEEREMGDGKHRTPGVDEHGRTREDRRAWIGFLRGG